MLVKLDSIYRRKKENPTCEETLSELTLLKICRSILTTKLEIWRGSITAEDSELLASRNLYSEDSSACLNAINFVDYSIKVSKPAQRFASILNQSLQIQIYHDNSVILQTTIAFQQSLESIGLLGSSGTHARSICLEENTKPNHVLFEMDLVMSEGTLGLIENGDSVWSSKFPIGTYEENQWHHFRLEREDDGKDGSLQLDGKKLLWRKLSAQLDFSEGGIGIYGRGKNGALEIDNLGIKSSGAEAFTTIPLKEIDISGRNNVNISISKIPVKHQSGLWDISAQTSYKRGIESSIPDVHNFLSKSYLSDAPVSLSALRSDTYSRFISFDRTVF